ncbi:MAG TPA: NYN domain-containing protein [Candidatus Limnocylindria bacterium]|nr:NYN domain-containing protein [Candidatus Limnocylindria bacterium]
MKTIVFIDGENLRHKLAEVLVKHRKIRDGQNLKKFDIRGFVEALVPEPQGLEIRYYGAKVKLAGKHKQTRQKTLAIIQQKRAWNSILKQQRVDYFETGALKVRSDGYPKNSEYLVEKGVDVGMAVDMIVAALKHNVRNIAFVSSDADLLPAVRVLKQEKIAVTYVAYESFVLPSLSQFSKKTRTFTDRQILKYFETHNPQKKRHG